MILRPALVATSVSAEAHFGLNEPKPVKKLLQKCDGLGQNWNRRQACREHERRHPATGKCAREVCWIDDFRRPNPAE